MTKNIFDLFLLEKSLPLPILFSGKVLGGVQDGGMAEWALSEGRNSEWALSEGRNSEPDNQNGGGI